MLPSSQRLSRQQVTALLSDPEIKVVFNRIGTLKYKISTGYALSVVTGSKLQKRAVLRNKARRRLYAVTASYIQKHPDHKGFSGILYISKQFYDFSYEDIKDLFYALLSKTAKHS